MWLILLFIHHSSARTTTPEILLATLRTIFTLGIEYGCVFHRGVFLERGFSSKIIKTVLGLNADVHS